MSCFVESLIFLSAVSKVVFQLLRIYYDVDDVSAC